MFVYIADCHKGDTIFINTRIILGLGNIVCLHKIIKMKKTTTLFLFIMAVMFGANAQVSVISIDSARYNNSNGVPVDSGMKVQLTGVVYGPNAYPTHNGNAFMLRGANLSIKVYSKRNCQYTVHDGDSVTVIGTLSTYHGDAEVDLFASGYNTTDTIIPLGTMGTVLAPYVVSSVSENDESQLVQINNVNTAVNTWTVPHPKHSFTCKVGTIYLFIDSFMSPDLWNLSGAPVGTYNIVGFGSQYGSAYPYNNGYSLQPRSLADFHQVNVGINETVNNLTAAVFPNPASTKLTVTFSYENEEAFTARIIDMTGRVVISETGTTVNGDNTMVYNTSALSNGLYVLELHTATKSLTTKVNISK